MARDSKLRNHEDDLDEILAACYDKPLDYVLSIFPWQFDTEIQVVKLAPKYRERFPEHEFGPDIWACEFLDQLGADIRSRGFDGKHAVPPIQYTTASGHGIGKSVMVAWLVKFISDTRPFSRGTVTANTADQLKSKTWSEVGKWHRKSLTAHRFDYKAGRGSMSLTHKIVPESWFCNAQTCREENSEAFAGQHAANSTSYYIFDEASAIPGKIFEVRGGGLTDGEPMVFDFGNPTRNSGNFYDSHEGDAAHRYRRFQIDSRNVAITNKLYIDGLISDFGLDSDYVRVRVKGEFPAQGSVQFIPTADVDTAMQREADLNFRTAPLVLGVDVAHFGDDETVIKPRMGMDARSWPARRFRGLDTVQVVGQVINTVNEFRALGVKVAAIFVDSVGIGAGVCDQLYHLGYNPTRVHASGGATDKKQYKRKGDEMWGVMRDAIHTHLVLPAAGTDEGNDLRTQLTAREYGITPGGQIALESKRIMKERLGAESSPDLGDALALTFAAEVGPDLSPGRRAEPQFTIHEYDPLAWLDKEMMT